MTLKMNALLLALSLVVSAAPVAAQTMTDGEIRKVDKDAAKLTIRHGPITNLDMPAMTMVFRVADPKLLGQLKAGDKVRFEVAREGGQLIVKQVELVTPAP